MIKSILFTLVFLTTSVVISSQEKENSKNTAYFELLGKGLLYSFNYEREIYRIDEKLAFNGSFGFSILPGFTDIEKSKDRVLPLEINVDMMAESDLFFFDMMIDAKFLRKHDITVEEAFAQYFKMKFYGVLVSEKLVFSN